MLNPEIKKEEKKFTYNIYTNAQEEAQIYKM